MGTGGSVGTGGFVGTGNSRLPDPLARLERQALEAMPAQPARVSTLAFPPEMRAFQPRRPTEERTWAGGRR